jgi:hypothetical protein
MSGRVQNAVTKQQLLSTLQGEGAGVVGVNRDDIIAPQTSLGAWIHVRREQFNVMDAVPLSQREAITQGVSTYDTLPHFMEAISYFGAAGAAAQGLVVVPRGKFMVSGRIPLRFETSIKGLAGRGSRIQAAGDFSLLGWDVAIPSFSRQVSITDLWLMGAGYGMQGATLITMAQAYTASAAGTNMAGIAAAFPGVVPFANSNAIDIDHPWGIDSLTLKRLWIEECPAIGIKTNQPASGATKNCIQFSDWDSLYIRNCNIGMSLGYGFTGESSFSNICSQFALLSNLDFTINPALTGPQGINFVNFVTGWSPNGVRMLGGTAGNIKFDMLHSEHHTTAAILMASPSINKLVLESPWFAANVAGISGSAGGAVAINNGTWQGAGNLTDTFIKLSAASNFTVSLNGQHTVLPPSTGSAPTDHISVPDISIVRGAVQRKSAVAGSISSNVGQSLFVQTRGITSETGTVLASNLSGSATIGNATSSVAVLFTRAEADTNYKINATVDWGVATGATWTPTVSIGLKTTAGFTAYFGTVAPAGGAILDWVLTR